MSAIASITDHPPLNRLLAARSADLRGDRIHLILACFYAFSLPVASLPMEVSFVLLALWTLIRLPHTRRSHVDYFRQPLIILCILWAAWQSIALLWSPDVPQGLDELRAFRVLLVPFFLWPVIDRAPCLIASILLGIFAQNIVQYLQHKGVIAEHHDLHGRLRGLLHPIQTGAFCAAALCWHVSAIIHARLKVSILSILGFLAAAFGLIYSGSRGPWLCAAIGVPLTFLIIFVRYRQLRASAAILAAICILGAVASWSRIGPMIIERYHNIVEDYHKARDAGDLTSDVGTRIRLWSWALEITSRHPVIGVGAGGFEHACRELPQAQQLLAKHPKKEKIIFRGHSHSTYLHTLATLGAVGELILLLVVIFAIRAALKKSFAHPWADALFPALLTWLIGAQFDCYHLNGHYFGLFAFIIALASAHVLVPKSAPPAPVPILPTTP